MKTNILRSLGMLCLAVMVCIAASLAHADGEKAADEKIITGTVTAVDPANKIIKVKQLLFTKTFVTTDNCAFTMGEHHVALADFQPGQRVHVTYKDAGGVLAANRITQEKLMHIGQVTDLDTANHIITIRQRGGRKTFTIGTNCAVILNGNSKGSLADIKFGNRVTVVYEIPHNELVARQIEQRSTAYVGTLDGVNPTARTITASKHLLGDKRFHLADDCAIVKGDSLDGGMNDLRLGRTYELSYETVDGINVVNRIALAKEQEKAETPQVPAGAGVASSETKKN